MIPMVEYGSKRVSKTAVFTTPATVLAHFGEELSYADLKKGLYLFEKRDQEKILAGVKQRQFEFWNDIETVQYYRDVHWQLPGMEEHAKKTLKSLNVQEGHVIVDLGCGWGRVAEQLLQTKVDFTYLGIDFADEMLRLARRDVERLGDGRVNFKNHDLSQGIPLESDCSDRILANWGIVYFSQKELKDALAEVSRVLKPDGLFVCAAIVEGANFFLLALRYLPAFINPKSRKIIMKGMKFGTRIKKLFPLYTKEQLELMIKEAGGLEIIDAYPTIKGRSVTIMAQKPT